MSSGLAAEEMNRVPSDDDTEPLLTYNTDFRGIDQREEKKRLPKCCLKCCCVFLVATLVVCGAAAIAVGVSYNRIDGAVKNMIASVSQRRDCMCIVNHL